MARPQLMEDALPELLKYHVVAGTPALAAGPLESLQGVSLDVTTNGAVKVRRLFSRFRLPLCRPHLLLGVTFSISCSPLTHGPRGRLLAHSHSHPRSCSQVDGAVVGEKVEASNGVIYSMDTVLVPPFLLPAKVQPLTDILAFKGWAPEVVNGRLAMLGFVYALGGEFSAHQSFLGQVSRPIATVRQRRSLRCSQSAECCHGDTPTAVRHYADIHCRSDSGLSQHSKVGPECSS